MNEQQDLINRITEVAIALCSERLIVIDVRYIGNANQLQIIVGGGFNTPPLRSLAIDLCDPGDSALSCRRVIANLRDAVTTLETLQRNLLNPARRTS